MGMKLTAPGIKPSCSVFHINHSFLSIICYAAVSLVVLLYRTSAFCGFEKLPDFFEIQPKMLL